MCLPTLADCGAAVADAPCGDTFVDVEVPRRRSRYAELANMLFAFLAISGLPGFADAPVAPAGAARVRVVGAARIVGGARTAHGRACLSMGHAGDYAEILVLRGIWYRGFDQTQAALSQVCEDGADVRSALLICRSCNVLLGDNQP